MRGAEWDEAERRDWSQRAVLVYVAVGVVSAVAVAALALAIFGNPFVETGAREVEPPAEFDATVSPGSGGLGTGDETIAVVHEGGERLDPERLSLRVDTGGSPAEDGRIDGVDWPEASVAEDGWDAGERATYTGEVPANASIQLVWTSETGDSKQILAAWDVAAVAVENATTASSLTGSAGPSAADAFPVPAQATFEPQSHAATAPASRSCAVGYETRAG